MRARRTPVPPAAVQPPAKPPGSADKTSGAELVQRDGSAAPGLAQELEWYFTYAESALHRAGVATLPREAALRVLARHRTDAAYRGSAERLARSVKTCLAGLHPRSSSVLRLAFTPRRRHKNLDAAFGRLAPIVVRISFARDPWPDRPSRTGVEEAAAARLSASLTQKERVPVARLRREAASLLRGGVVAYRRARAKEGPPLDGAKIARRGLSGEPRSARAGSSRLKESRRASPLPRHARRAGSRRTPA